MYRVGSDLEIAHAMSGPKDGLTHEPLLAAAVGKDAVEGTPARAAEPLAGKHPDPVIRADRHNIVQAEAMERREELAALAIQAIGQDHAEPEALRLQFLDELHGQL